MRICSSLVVVSCHHMALLIDSSLNNFSFNWKQKNNSISLIKMFLFAIPQTTRQTKPKKIHAWTQIVTSLMEETCDGSCWAERAETIQTLTNAIMNETIRCLRSKICGKRYFGRVERESEWRDRSGDSSQFWQMFQNLLRNFHLIDFFPTSTIQSASNIWTDLIVWSNQETGAGRQESTEVISVKLHDHLKLTTLRALQTVLGFQLAWKKKPSSD